MADLIPAPRPVPTTEDRMRDARTFRTWMSDTERDQLDAEAACARQERDEALDDRDAYREARDTAQQLATFRQGVIDRHRQELGAAGEVIAVVRDAVDRIDRALAAYDTQPTEPADAEPQPEQHEDPARLRQQLAEAHADCARYATERDRARKMAEDLNAETMVLNDTIRSQAAELAALGSPSPRAQETDVPDWVLILIRSLAQYEHDHPKLYAQFAGSDEYRPAPCPCGLLEGVPVAVRERAEREG